MKWDVVVAMKAAAVSMKDVEDFERQVAAADGHGIMCTAVGKVARRDAVDFRQLSSGGYVWYLAEVGYDVGAVVGLVGEVYGMDERMDFGDRLRARVRAVKKAYRVERENVEMGRARRDEGLWGCASKGSASATGGGSTSANGGESVANGGGGASASKKTVKVRTVRGYVLIKVDGERRYECAGCKAVRASGEDMRKHLRTCVGGRKVCAVDDVEGSGGAEADAVN